MDDLDGLFAQGHGSPGTGAMARAAGALRDQFEKGLHGYADVSGDGTRWKVSGSGHGVSFAIGEVELRQDGLATVYVDAGQTFRDPERARFAGKLFASYNAFLKVPGLCVEDGGKVAFRSGAFDPVAGASADDVVGLALSTVHAYAFVWAALESGVDPWALLTDPIEPDGDGEAPAGRDEAMERFLRELLDNPADAIE